MRFNRFTLDQYGPFHSTTVVLDARPGVVNVILAPNGAGKSVLRQGFRDLIFGIGAQSPMSFRYGYKSMRLMADVVDQDGRTLSIGRRKGRGNTLIDAASGEVDPSVMASLIGGADESLFDRLFALDTHLLRDGGNALIDSGGDLAEALFAAGGGTAHIRKVREAFEATRDAIAPVRATASRPLYQALEQFRGAGNDLKADTVRPEVWARTTASIGTNEARRADLTREHARCKAEEDRLNRLKRVRPWVDQYRAAAAAASALAEKPILPADIEVSWARAKLALTQSATAVVEHQATLAGLAERLNAVQADQAVLEQGGHIEALTRALGQVDADHRDLPKREAEYRSAADRLRATLLELGIAPDATLPDAPSLAAVRDLIRRHDAIEQALRQARQDQAKAERDLAEAQARLATLPPLSPTDAIADLATGARRDGDPLRRLKEFDLACRQARAKLAAALAQVPFWSGDAQALIALVVPGNDLVIRLAKTLAEATRKRDDCHQLAERLGRENQRDAKRLVALRQGGTLPEPAVVQAARSDRDQRWHLIRRIKFEGIHDPDAVAAQGGEAGLAAGFEQALGDADHLVDRRDSESERLAALAELNRAAEQNAMERDAAGKSLDAATAMMASAANDWAMLTAGLGLKADASATDVQDLLVARRKVIDVQAELDLAITALAQEEARQADMATRLAMALELSPTIVLADALTEADRRLNAQAKANAVNDKLAVEAAALSRRKDETAAKLAEAVDNQAIWTSAWTIGLAETGRPAAEVPAATEKALELIERARADRSAVADLKHRIDGMAQNIAAFEAQLSTVVAVAAPDLGKAAPEVLEKALRSRLVEARKKASATEELHSQAEVARASLETALGAQSRSIAAVEHLRAQIGVGQDEAVLERLAEARERSEAEAALTKAATRLADHGEGWSLETLSAEVDALSAEALEIRLAEVAAQRETLSSAREDAASAATSLSHELAAMTAIDKTLDAEERRQSAVASLRRISADAFMQHAAACLLGEALDRLRKAEDEDSVIARVGASFAGLTGGIYHGVAAEEDQSGRPYLVAIEADGTTSKRVEELSEGTRDQLFLSLRLVMLMDYAAKAKPLPFIADDLLQTFDDARSRHALEALIDLSHHTQIIVLTHHTHVARMAAEIGNAVRVIDLQVPAASLAVV
jgi:uncharacterized protein YhaN